MLVGQNNKYYIRHESHKREILKVKSSCISVQHKKDQAFSFSDSNPSVAPCDCKSLTLDYVSPTEYYPFYTTNMTSGNELKLHGSFQ